MIRCNPGNLPMEQVGEELSIVQLDRNGVKAIMIVVTLYLIVSKGLMERISNGDIANHSGISRDLANQTRIVIKEQVVKECLTNSVTLPKIHSNGP